jgi:putative copper resistance protein D
MTTPPPSTLHLILASTWVGGVLAFLIVVFVATRKHSFENDKWCGVQTLKRLSAMVQLVLGTVLVTGVMAAHPMVAPKYAAVFVTHYGWLLITKSAILFVSLVIGLRMHFVWLPGLGKNAPAASVASHKLRKWVTIEGVLALALVWAASLLAKNHPPIHVTIHDWPYPFRVDIAGTWGMGMLDVMLRVWVGIGVFILAIGSVEVGRTKQWGPKWRLAVPLTLSGCALVVGVPALIVPAYPETYRPTPVPFVAKSVAHGMALFTANCVPCHGPQGKGNGVLAKTLPKQPVDLLTEPHADMHTAGDFFHWLTYGIPGTGMPAWGEKFSDEERWDLVNLVHAISRGYQARLISPRVLPDQPYLAPPDFYFTTHEGTNGRLKALGRQNTVLLVVFSWPESRKRLEQLKLSYGTLSKHGAEVLLVPMKNLDQQEMEAVTRDMPFPLVTDGAAEIARTYSLFRRTITNPDLTGEGTIPNHMEFLFDRFSFLRARWVPETDGTGWTDIDLLTQQVDQLNQEREIVPPPGDYVHDTASGMQMGGMKM